MTTNANPNPLSAEELTQFRGLYERFVATQAPQQATPPTPVNGPAVQHPITSGAPQVSPAVPSQPTSNLSFAEQLVLQLLGNQNSPGPALTLSQPSPLTPQPASTDPGPGELTIEQVGRMDANEINTRWPEVQKALGQIPTSNP